MDSLPKSEQAVDGEILAHLEGCEECRSIFAHRQSFDARVRKVLHNVSVPPDLQKRLLSVIASQPDDSAPRVNSDGLNSSPPMQRSAKSRLKDWRLVTALATCLAIGTVVAMLFPDVETETPLVAIEYANVRHQLSETFLRPNVDWQQFPQFDGAFPTTGIDRPLRRWTLSAAVGIDLGNDAAHDAAVYQFQYQKWQGILVVVPTSLIEHGPAQTFPNPTSSRSSLEWQSPNGEFTYLCFVNSGSPDGLITATYGNMG